MYTKHWTEDGIDESTVVAEAGDIECECGEIVHDDDAIECDICHVKHCKACITSNNHGTGLNVCDNCQDNGNFIGHLVGQIYNLTYDKTEYRKTLKKIVDVLDSADVLTQSDIGTMQGYVKAILEIVK